MNIVGKEPNTTVIDWYWLFPAKIVYTDCNNTEYFQVTENHVNILH